jgi:D-galactarolactone cycloisomerase
MRIEAVHAFGLRGGTPPGGWSNELDADDCIHTLVVVISDDGQYGLGTCFTNDHLVKAALTVLEPLCVGRDLEPERVTESLDRDTFWLGRGGAITHALSGLDIALWDLFGKRTGLPVASLLAGQYRTRVRPYASILMTEAESMRAQLEELHARGFRAFKLGWGPFGRVSDRKDEELVATARTTIGRDSRLMIDAGGSDGLWSNGLKWAVRASHMLAEYGVDWFEEPLRPDDIEGYRRLTDVSRVPIAAGEVLTRRQSFIPWIAGRALDIVQPDATKVGGLTQSRRIAWMADDAGMQMVPHGWNTGVGLAADIHLACALPATDMVEYRPGSPYIDELVQIPWTLNDEGLLPLPTGPGLGIQLNPDALGRYAPAALEVLGDR